MKKVRIIPRIDVKGEHVVKGIHLEGIRKVGKPGELAQKYYQEGADEILYMDVVASLYGRNSLTEVIDDATKEIFIPMTVGGGVRTSEDLYTLLRAGADKVSINTAAIQTPELITEAAHMFGSQCVVVSIEAKKQPDGSWEPYYDSGREKTGLDAIQWAKHVVELGAGEIIITSVDQEGTKKGFDIELINAVAQAVPVPVIACGGCGTIQHIIDCFEQTPVEAISIASVLHYNLLSLTEIKEELHKNDIEVRI